MDELSTSGIDNHYSVLHFTDGIVVDEIFGLLSQRAVQGDDIRIVIKLIQAGIYHLVFTGKIIVGIEVVGKDIHAESAQDTYQFFGNFSRTDDACCLSVHVEAQKSVQREVSVPCPPGGAWNFTVEG